MKKLVFISFLFFVVVSFSQKKVVEKFESKLTDIIISTEGLDDFVIENSISGYVEIILFAENSNQQHILIEEKNNEIQVQFKLDKIQEKEIIFRKFITERLQRANAIIKIPKAKKVTIYGENIDIESKSIQNDLEIYIENGIVKLNEIQKNTSLKLYSGNVYGVPKDCNIDVISRNGKIKIDSILHEKKYKRKLKKYSKAITITSIKANIFLE